MWTTLLFGGAAALFLGHTLFTLWHLRWVWRLPALDALPPGYTGTDPGQKPVRCSVVIAARNEQARIEQTLRHLLAQQGVALEIIVVDDRSTDGTADVLRRIAGEDARVQARRIDTLPEGWLGKCHACHTGAGAATGDWILFTDADCWLKPDVLARALRVAEREEADHITLISGLDGSAGLKASHLLFLVSMANWVSGVNRDRPRSYVGLGAFNLVRAAAYRKCGGYEALRLTVLDDVRLGLLLRRAGGRTRAFLGSDDVVAHWGRKAWDMVNIMEKNYFAALDFRVALAVAGSLFVIALMCVVMAGLFSGTASGLAAALAPWTLVVPAGILARRVGWPWRSALLVPLMVPVMHYALLNSTVKTLRQGGIRWRETFYPLKALREGTVR